ncbi:MAG TPA: histidine phosphatase family protein [Candidatus Limnocylindria bacterium]|nr:histidine phosphatase family protein [Candidatus Limnocylindria bacterium]
MSSLVLVKHSAPTVVAAVPPPAWHLSPTGAARCAALAERLRRFDTRSIASSVEPKAVETATLVGRELGRTVELVPDLHEHDRRDAKLLGDAEFALAIAALFARPRELVFGRETAAGALERFERAIGAVLAAAPPDDDVIVVTHGTVISLFVAAHAGIDGLGLWKRLGLPSFVVLGRTGLGIERVEIAVT